MSKGRIGPRDVAEGLGVAAVVASVLFLAIQVRQAREIAVSETDAALLETHIQLQGFLSEHASVWARGSAREPMSPGDSIIFRSLVQAHNDVAFIDYRRAARLGSDNAEVTRQDFAGLLFANPGARDAWLARENSLIEPRRHLTPDRPDFSFWREEILADLAKLDALAN